MIAIKINKDTKEVVFRGRYPRWDMGQLTKGDKAYKWLLQVEVPAPPYDSEISRLERVEKVTNIPHPDYPNFNQYQVGWKVVKKTIADVEREVVQEEEMKNTTVFGVELKEKLIAKALNVLFNHMDKSDFTDNELKIVDRISEIVEQYRINRQQAEDRIIEITNKLNT